MDEKDRELQELRRQVESLKAVVVKRGKWIEFKRRHYDDYDDCVTASTVIEAEGK